MQVSGHFLCSSGPRSGNGAAPSLPPFMVGVLSSINRNKIIPERHGQREIQSRQPSLAWPEAKLIQIFSPRCAWRLVPWVTTVKPAKLVININQHRHVLTHKLQVSLGNQWQSLRHLCKSLCCFVDGLSPDASSPQPSLPPG